MIHNRSDAASAQSNPHKQACEANGRSQKNNPIENFLSGLFSDGKIDNDRLIIIILIIILARNGADLKLMIALGYILM